MKELLVTREAELDVLEIYLYLSNSTNKAVRVTMEIDAKFHALREFPLMGRSREELGANYRSFPVGDYIIVYLVSGTQVSILRVLHGSRDLTGIFPQGN